MARVEKEAEFQVPVSRAFDLVADIGRMPEYVPALSGVSNVSGRGMGTTYNWEFKLGKLPAFRGKGKIVKLIPNRRMEIQTKGGIPSTWQWAFSGHNERSIIKLGIEYKIPGGALVSGLVGKQIEEGLVLLRGLLES